MQLDRENDPIIPRRAAVRPRVHRRAGASSPALPLEGYVEELLAKNSPEPVNIYGPPGSGKSTALAHLAAVCGGRVHLVDGPWPPKSDPQGATAIEMSKLVVYATEDAQLSGAFAMARWERDDVIEYLLGAHPAECRSIMQRLTDQGDELLGAPELWVIVLDQFAADPALAEVSTAIRRHVAALLGDAAYYHEVARQSLEKACQREWKILPRRRPRDRNARLLSYLGVTLHLAAEALCTGLAAQETWALVAPLPPALLRAAAPLLGRSPEAIDFLIRSLHLAHIQSAGVSLLIAAQPAWRPAQPLAHLSDAQLQNAQWSGVDLSKCDLLRANLSGADLSGANLSHANAAGANFSRARLAKARLDEFLAQDANFSGADLSGATGDGSLFNDATLARASLRMARLNNVLLARANVAGCDLSRAILAGAQLERAQVDGANFTGAVLDRSKIAHTSFRRATLDRASFEQASLIACDFEGMEIAAVNFHGASLMGSLFTGSIMHGADFSGACLRRTGLADVDWEGANLRDADLREASFHMGSSRSGLVHSDIASEGTRTGFYTDDYCDQDFKAPEEIRKANLCGCDLRGANVENTDFYLVDLRGAQYTDDQREHFARCGAIRRSRV